MYISCNNKDCIYNLCNTEKRNICTCLFIFINDSGICENKTSKEEHKETYTNLNSDDPLGLMK
jgi:hypothetical protein